MAKALKDSLYSRDAMIVLLLLYAFIVWLPLHQGVGVVRDYLFIDTFFLFVLTWFLIFIYYNKVIVFDIVGQLLLLFLAINVVGLIYALAIVKISESSTVIHVFLNLCRGIVLYLIAFNIFKSKEDFLRLSIFFTVLAIIASIYMVYEYFYVKKTITTIFKNWWPVFNANYYQSALLELSRRKEGYLLWRWLGGSNGRGALLLIWSSYLIGLVRVRSLSVNDFIGLIAFVFMVYALSLQGSSSKLFFLVFILGVWVLRQFEVKTRRGFGGKRLLLVGSVVIIVGFIIGASSTLLRTKLVALFSGMGSLGKRGTIIVSYFLNSAENGLLGNGFHTIYLASGEVSSVHPHNVFLETLSDSGFLGLIVLILVLAFCWRNSEVLVKSKEDSLRKIGMSLQLLLLSTSLCFLVTNYMLKSALFQATIWTLLGCGNRLAHKSRLESYGFQRRNYSLRRT